MNPTRLLIRIVYIVCALIVAYMGVEFAGEASRNRDTPALMFILAATGVVVACLIDWAIERERA